MCGLGGVGQIGEVVYQLASVILRSILRWTIPDHTARVRVSRLQAWGLGFGGAVFSSLLHSLKRTQNVTKSKLGLTLLSSMICSWFVSFSALEFEKIFFLLLHFSKKNITWDQV